jgi:hypothetical protein
MIIYRTNINLAVILYLGLMFMNLIFLAFHESKIFYEVLILYSCMIPIFIPILFLSAKYGSSPIRRRHEVILAAFLLIYFSDGFFFLSEEPDISRIEIFQRFGPLNRIIIIFVQYMTVKTLINNNKIVATCCLVALLLTGFRSFIIDPIIIYLVCKAFIDRKLFSVSNFLMLAIAVLAVVYLTISRFNHLDSLKDIADIFSYAQVYNINSVAHWAKSNSISSVSMDMNSLLFGSLSFAQQYTQSTGNMSVQTAAVTLYAYMAAYDSVSHAALFLFAIGISFVLHVRKKDPIFVIFSLWMLSRGLLSNGIIYAIFLVGIPLLFIQIVSRIKL